MSPHPPVRRVAVLIDRERRVAGDPELRTKKARKNSLMEFHLGRVLRKMGYDVAMVPCLSGRQVVDALTALAPDVVYNATEHMYGFRGNDVHVAALLESLRIPYTGASPAALLLGRDKALSKSLAMMAGVRVPPFTLAVVGDRVPRGVPPLPVVVKPVNRDASEGISLACVARTRAALERRIRVVHETYREPAIVESFVEGTDLYAFVLHNGSFRILPPYQLCVETNGDARRSMATFSVKHDDAYRKRWGIHCKPAELSSAARREIHRSIRKLWPVLQLRDYARFDFRMTPSGEIYFIEANPNPAFSPDTRYDPWPEDEYMEAVRLLISAAMERGTD